MVKNDTIWMVITGIIAFLIMILIGIEYGSGSLNSSTPSLIIIIGVVAIAGIFGFFIVVILLEWRKAKKKKAAS